MTIGIVGSEATKFSHVGIARARDVIKSLLLDTKPDMVISGACHLGGIDIWAIDEASKLGIKTLEFPPLNLHWGSGYKARNISIANNSDFLVCITVDKYPKDYMGMRFKKCYHCNTGEHVKSGGCWTMKKAESLGKRTMLIVLDNE